jgi:hypothetical protein
MVKRDLVSCPKSPCPSVIGVSLSVLLTDLRPSLTLAPHLGCFQGLGRYLARERIEDMLNDEDRDSNAQEQTPCIAFPVRRSVLPQ